MLCHTVSGILNDIRGETKLPRDGEGIGLTRDANQETIGRRQGLK